MWDPAADTYERNHPSVKMIRGDIRSDAVQQEIYEVALEHGLDVVVGGFPCQGFSLSGNRDPLDSRSQLYREYLRVVAAVKPVAFVMENVKGLASMRVIPPDLPDRDLEYLHCSLKKIQRLKDLKRYKAQRQLDEAEASEFEVLDEEVPALRQEIKEVMVPLLPIIENEIRALGYTPSHKILDAADYGTAQSRERIFIVAIKNGLASEFEFPVPLQSRPRSSQEAIGDLEDMPAGFLPNHDFTDHAHAFVQRIAKVKPGETLYKFSDAWWRLVSDQPSRTVKENHGAVFLHYSKDRVITPREMARLQDFGDDFVFEGPKSMVLKQIGNAVPVGLATAMGTALKNFLDEHVTGTAPVEQKSRKKRREKKVQSVSSSVEL